MADISVYVMGRLFGRSTLGTGVSETLLTASLSDHLHPADLPPSRSGLGGGTSLFTADFTQSTLAAMGFSSGVPDEDTYGRCTRSIQVGGGPGGRNCIRWAHHPLSQAQVTAIGNPQGYWGSITYPSSWTAPAPGDPLYFHLYVRVVDAANCDNIHADGIIDNDFRQKTIDIGNGATGSARFILYSAVGQSGGLGATNSWEMRMAVGTDRTNVLTRPTVAMGWTAVVMELRGANPAGSGNGVFRMATNRDSGWDYENTAVDINVSEGGNSWNGFNFHQFNDATIGDADGVGPAMTLELAGVKASYERDTAWYANMT